jgi:hypothetical protein
MVGKNKLECLSSEIFFYLWLKYQRHNKHHSIMLEPPKSYATLTIFFSQLSISLMMVKNKLERFSIATFSNYLWL